MVVDYSKWDNLVVSDSNDSDIEDNTAEHDLPTTVVSNYDTRSKSQTTTKDNDADTITITDTPNNASKHPAACNRHQDAPKNASENATPTNNRTSKAHGEDDLQNIIDNITAAINLVKSMTVYKASSPIKDKVLQKMQTAVKDLQTTRLKAAAKPIDTIEEKLNHIVDKLTAMDRAPKNAPTYAEIAQLRRENEDGTAKRIQEIREMNLQAREKRRIEAAKYEVTLTLEHADSSVKELPAKATHEQIAKQLQTAIERTTEAEPKPTIQGIQKLKSGDIRIKCSTTAEANELRDMDWSTAYEGIEVRKPKYGIVVHRVPSQYINLDSKETMTEMIQHIEQQNESKSLKILSIAPLRKKSNRPGPNSETKPIHQSITIFTYDPNAADACIKQGTNIKWGTYRSERYAPQLRLTQCYNCQKFGHIARNCRSKHTCGKCSSHDHATPNCTTEEPKCPACQGGHPSWHSECPVRAVEINKLLERRRNTSPYFE